MAKYLYEGIQYSEQDVMDKALSLNLTLDDYLNTTGSQITVIDDPVIDTEEIIEGDDKKKKKDKEENKEEPTPIEVTVEEEPESEVEVYKSPTQEDAYLKNQLNIGSVKRERQFRRQNKKFKKQ